MDESISRWIDVAQRVRDHEESDNVCFLVAFASRERVVMRRGIHAVRLWNRMEDATLDVELTNTACVLPGLERAEVVCFFIWCTTFEERHH